MDYYFYIFIFATDVHFDALNLLTAFNRLNSAGLHKQEMVVLVNHLSGQHAIHTKTKWPS